MYNWFYNRKYLSSFLIVNICFTSIMIIISFVTLIKLCMFYYLHKALKSKINIRFTKVINIFFSSIFIVGTIAYRVISVIWSGNLEGNKANPFYTNITYNCTCYYYIYGKFSYGPLMAVLLGLITALSFIFSIVNVIKIDKCKYNINFVLQSLNILIMMTQLALFLYQYGDLIIVGPESSNIIYNIKQLQSYLLFHIAFTIFFIYSHLFVIVQSFMLWRGIFPRDFMCKSNTTTTSAENEEDDDLSEYLLLNQYISVDL